MNKKRIFVIFVILLILAMVPLKFTTAPEPYVFGWLPGPLLYWWILMVLNLIFVFWISKEFVKSEKEEEENEN